MDKRALLSICLVFDLYAASCERIGFDEIMPCVVHGVCTTCQSSSCNNCIKCSSGPCKRNDRDCEVRACVTCSDKGSFCSLPENRLFEDDGKTRTKACKRDGEGACSFGCATPHSVFIPRSQGANTARELAGWEEFIHQYDVGEFYLTTGHVLGYYNSFRTDRIAHALFGDTVLRFAGSRVPTRGRCELLADNFGLSPEFRGEVSIHPRIENVIFDNQFFIGLDPWLCGLYARIHIPVVHTRWSLGLHQKVIEKGSSEFPTCYMAGTAVPATDDIVKALSGKFLFGEMQEPWHFGRFCCGSQSRTGVADCDLILGYDFWQCDTYHLGCYGQLVAPTGNKPSARHIFEPVLGNGHHWELGLGISGHLVLWERDTDHSLAIYVEGNATHLFKNTQHRSFDFCKNGLLSRYMLLKELDDTLAYTGKLINGIDFATRQVEVSIAVKGDISAKLSYRSPCLIFDLGYNFYGQTRESLSCVSRDPRIVGIKGTEGVCGLEYQVQGTQPPLTFGPLVAQIPLNSTQSDATIRRGALTDNAQSPAAQSPQDIVVSAFSRQTGSIEGRDVIPAFVSNPPVVLSSDDLHLRSGAMPSMVTQKVFGYIGYNFAECDTWYNPYVGIGGELEVDGLSCSERSSLNQWGIWIKGGLEF